MSDEFDILSVYEQNLNFLIGAGASHGFLPTLALNIKDEAGKPYTIETLAKVLDEKRHDNLYSLLFMHYYKKCIWTGLPRLPHVPFPPDRIAVLERYEKFLGTLLSILEKQEKSSKKCNIYTTNYDGCLEVAAEELLTNNGMSFSVNDGSSGFQRRRFHTKNFNNRVIQRGIFDRHNVVLPQLNILHPHGSVYWMKVGGGIEVNYGNTEYDIVFNAETLELLDAFRLIVEDPEKSLHDLLVFEIDIPDAFSSTNFWASYKKIPIVNPTKWKFYETVFEEAYYQILRHLSFELEKPNSVLLTFGFSFADEHILHLVQRSLSNPSLILYVSCFNQAEKLTMQEKFAGYKNVKFICVDDDLTFERFNAKIFTLDRVGADS